MLQSEAAELVKKLARLFSNWQPTADEAKGWESVFRGCDKDDAERALDKYWKSPRRFNTPRPGGFLEIIGGYAKAKADPKDRPDPTTDVWIMCMEAPEQAPMLLGWFLAVFLGPLDRVHEHHRLMAAAEKMKQDYADQYGGEWAVFQGASHTEMQANRNRMRAEHPELDRPHEKKRLVR